MSSVCIRLGFSCNAIQYNTIQYNTNSLFTQDYNVTSMRFIVLHTYFTFTTTTKWRVDFRSKEKEKEKRKRKWKRRI